MKVCFYAINGHGLGHLSRCHAIAKRLNDLLLMVGVTPDIQILTTSDADYVVKDFPVFKIPSKSCFKGRSGASSRYASNGKMMISAMLSHFSPDVLIMDTIATGSFNEFTFIKDFAKKKVLIERHKNADYSGSAVHQSHLPLFSKIIIPDEIENLEDYSFSKEILQKVSCVGMVHNFDLSKAFSKSEVRAFFGVSDKKIAYISAGGGGDENAREQLEMLLDAFPGNWHLVIGYGPLCDAPKIYNRPNVSAITEGDIWKYFKGLDLAVCAAGYNTYEELLAAKVPTMFFAQEKGLDQQDRRISKGLREGWHDEIDLNASILQQLNQFLSRFDPAALMSRSPKQGASAAALQIALLNPAITEAQLLDLEHASIIQEWLICHIETPIDVARVFQTYQRIFQPDTTAERTASILRTLHDLDGLLAKGDLARNLRHSVTIQQFFSQQPGMTRAENRQIYKQLRAELYHQSIDSAELNQLLKSLPIPQL
ncbi:MAG: UDP-N-acetylglucosamine--N-acetylmuramyl-(pentapeptide) pyrophosphoryl-undecaprenol N-acetylglucosamine transferase [Akkermansiaceae bacterium]|jgi:UDP-N-acetylglucosamine--N-acetylmuramyl-(pentapeptide) pyrophosphoryl-undecaprenol N-acetylglucosamine transferase